MILLVKHIRDLCMLLIGVIEIEESSRQGALYRLQRTPASSNVRLETERPWRLTGALPCQNGRSDSSRSRQLGKCSPSCLWGACRQRA